MKATSGEKSAARLIHVLRLAVKLAWDASPRLFCAAALLALISGTLPLATVSVSSSLIGTVATLINHQEQRAQAGHLLLPLLLYSGGLAAAGQLLNRFSEALHRIYQRVATTYVQNRLYAQSASVDLSSFDSPLFYTRLQRAFSNSMHRPVGVLSQLLQLCSSFTTIILVAIVVGQWHWWLIALSLISPAVLQILALKQAKENSEIAERRVDADRKAQYIGSLMTGDWAAKEIRVFGLREYLLGKVRKLWKDSYAEELLLTKRRLVRRGVGGAIAQLDKPLLVGIVAFEAIGGTIGLTKFSFYTQILTNLQNSFKNFANSIASLYEHSLFLESLFAFLAIVPVAEAERKNEPRFISNARSRRVEFRNVSFTYPESDKFALQNVSFVIEAGKTVAFIGANGSGKSTIIKLLLGLYRPTSGSILIDNVDIDLVNRTTLRREIAAILQDFMIYHMDICSNVEVGDTEKLGQQEMIESSANESGLSTIVDNLKNRYNTILGKQFNDGHELSGGQRQIVALTRLIFRSAPIIVLDEPTSALDTYSEKRLVSRITSAEQSSTILLVTHRMNLARKTQRIVVLEGGTIAEQGSHSDLMEKGGIYHHLYQVQAKEF